MKIIQIGNWYRTLIVDEIKLNLFLAFIAQSSFTVPKNVRLNLTQHFVMKIQNKREL